MIRGFIQFCTSVYVQNWIYKIDWIFSPLHMGMYSSFGLSYRINPWEQVLVLNATVGYTNQ